MNRRVGFAAVEWLVSDGQGVDVNDPRRRHGRAEYQAAIYFERSTVEVRVSQSVAPSLEEFVDYTGNLAPHEAFIDGEESIHRSQGNVARDDDLDDWGTAILSKEFLALRTEKMLRHLLVEFGAMREVVIEAVDQSASGECQMRLPLPASGLVSRPKFLQGRIESVLYVVPSGMGGKCPLEAGLT